MIIEVGKINGKLDIDTTYDFSNKIDKEIDILSIEPCKIKGSLLLEYEELHLDLDIDVKMKLASSRSLRPVDYHLKFNLELLFGSSEKSDFPLEDQIPLSDIIYGHILLEKPLSIYLDDELEETEEPKKKVHPAFKELENWK